MAAESNTLHCISVQSRADTDTRLRISAAAQNNIQQTDCVRPCSIEISFNASSVGAQ